MLLNKEQQQDLIKRIKGNKYLDYHKPHVIIQTQEESIILIITHGQHIIKHVQFYICYDFLKKGYHIFSIVGQANVYEIENLNEILNDMDLGGVK